MVLKKYLAAFSLVMVLANGARASIDLDSILGGSKNETVNGAEVIKVADESGEANTMQLIADEGDEGPKVIETPNGAAFTMTRKASYGNYPNIDATLLHKRLAYVQAYFHAKNALIKYFDGLQSQGFETFKDNADDFADENETMANGGAISVTEKINQSLSGRIQNFIVYAVKDMPNKDGGEVSVTLAVSRKIGQNCRAFTEGYIEAKNLADGIKYVFDQLQKGVLPPVGGKMIRVPQTGEVAIISVGSEIVLNRGTVSRSKEVARRRARARAENCMIEILQGSDNVWNYGLSSSQEAKMNELFVNEVKQDEFGNQQKIRTRLEEVRNTFNREAADNVAGQSAVKGVLPPGVQDRVYFSADGAWCFCVKVYTPALTLRAKQIRREIMETPQNVATPNQTLDGAAPSRRPSGPLQAPAKGPSGRVQDDSAI